MTPDQFMSLAIDTAISNVHSGGGPFGAVIAFGDQLIAVGANRVTSTNDPTAHAEIVAIREACRLRSSFELRGCEIYTSCEPCPMCLAAIHWARIDRVFFSASASDAAASGFDDEVLYAELARPHPERRIPIASMLRERALEPFQAWQSAADRTPY